MTRQRTRRIVITLTSKPRQCVECGAEFYAYKHAAYCSPACKQKAYRRRRDADAVSGQTDTSNTIGAADLRRDGNG